MKEQERVLNLYKESNDYVFEFELLLTEVHSGTVQKDAEKITCISVWILEEHKSRSLRHQRTNGIYLWFNS